MKNISMALLLFFLLSNIAMADEEIVQTPTAIESEEIWQEYSYIGIAFISQRTFSVGADWFNDGALTQDETAGFTAIVGYNYNEYIAFEARVSKSLFEEDYADILSYALFLKPQYKFIDRERDNSEDGYITLYALLGYGKTKVTGTDGKTPGFAGENITDGNGVEWAIGFSYTLDDDEKDDEPHSRDGDVTLFMEYNVFMRDRDIFSRLYQYDPIYYEILSQDAISLGLNYRF